MTTRTEIWYQETDPDLYYTRTPDEGLIQSQAEAAADEARYEAAYQAKAEIGVLDLEEYAFDLLNNLADEFQVYDEGGIIARRIWDANTSAELQPIIDELQRILLEAMQIKTVAFTAHYWVGDGRSIEETLG